MKKVGNHKSFSKIFFSLAFMLTFSLSVFSQDAAVGGDPAKGKALFNSQCAACHKLDAKATGPALRGVADKYETEWLYKWIKNSAELIKSGDALAIKVFEENGKVPMTAFPQLSNADIDDILAYTSEVAPPPPTPEPGKTTGGSVEGSGISNNVILGALALVLGMLVVMLFLVNNVLTKIAKANGIEVESKEKAVPIWVAFARNQFLVLVSAIAFLLVAAYFAYGWFMQIGVDQGYAPVQPIHYSHKIHAGDNGIDCKYCHSAARVSKHSNIPSLNVCMNCHMAINEYNGEKMFTEDGEEVNGTQEIEKLYKYAGFEPGKPWDASKAKPIEWVRIHNLPDHVYFNHAQHVKAGQVACQTCHGEIQKMGEVKQQNDLSMGWCINCHRETKVQFKDNGFYSIYEKYHQDLKSGKMDSTKGVTVESIGGTECQKCHY